MTQPSAQRFIMEDRFLDNNTTINGRIDDEISDRGLGDTNTLNDAMSYTDIQNAGNLAILLTSSATRNHVLNGAFDVWQRGTTFTGTGGFGPDRWYIQASSSSTWAQDPVLVWPASLYSLKMTAGVADSQFYAYQVIETINTAPLIGKNVLITAKLATSINADVRLGIEYSTTVDNVMSGSWTMINSDVITATTEYNQLSVEVDIPITAKTLRIVVYTDAALPAGASLNISSVQLEVGITTATNFHRQNQNYQMELAACQRYYYRVNGTVVGQPFGMGNAITATAARAFIAFPVSMRIAPTALEQSGTAANYAVTNGAGTGVACSAVPTHVSAGTSGARVNFTVASGLTVGQGSMVLANATTSYFGWSAELV